MKDCVPTHSPYKNDASAVDNLGWDCFVEGRIPQVLIGVVKPMLRHYIPRGSVELWGARFINTSSGCIGIVMFIMSLTDYLLDNIRN